MSHAKPAFVLTVLSKAEGSERFSFFTYTCLSVFHILGVFLCTALCLYPDKC